MQKHSKQVTNNTKPLGEHIMATSKKKSVAKKKVAKKAPAKKRVSAKKQEVVEQTFSVNEETQEMSLNDIDTTSVDRPSNMRNANPVEAKVAEQRPQRISVAKQRDKLSIAGQDPSRHYHWINDKDGGQRIAKLELAGYRIETDQSIVIGTPKMSDSSGLGNPHRQFAGMTKDGKVMYAYLMSQKMEWWDQDQAEKHGEITMNETAQHEEVRDGYYQSDSKLSDDTARQF